MINSFRLRAVRLVRSLLAPAALGIALAGCGAGAASRSRRIAAALLAAGVQRHRVRERDCLSLGDEVIVTLERRRGGPRTDGPDESDGEGGRAHAEGERNG